MIRIRETENEYLLSIPAAQKERAKGIQGRWWDPQRICWVYPRTNRVYSALIAEFGDDLTQESVLTPPPSIHGEDESEGQETTELIERIEGIDQTLSELLRFLNHADTERAEILVRQERQIQYLKNQYRAKSSEAAELKNRIDQLKVENSRLYRESTASSHSNRYEIVKEMALEVTGHDRVFGEQFRNFKIDGTLPLRIANLLEDYLRKLLTSESTLNELIRVCNDEQVLDRLAVGIAHALRIQRNKVAHLKEPEDPRIEMGRALFCLFGASLLFPELPEITEDQSTA